MFRAVMMSCVCSGRSDREQDKAQGGSQSGGGCYYGFLHKNSLCKRERIISFIVGNRTALSGISG
jgi:hypothetical protein